MTTPMLCLLGFAAWTLALVFFGIGVPRITAVLAGKARPNAFPADQPHGTPLYRRTMRAHANCVENLPIFGAVVLVAAVAGIDTPRLDTLAVVFLAARVCQTLVHLSSGRSLVVNIRFAFYMVQFVCVIWMGLSLVV